jgi:hypothetical protein
VPCQPCCRHILTINDTGELFFISRPFNVHPSLDVPAQAQVELAIG